MLFEKFFFSFSFLHLVNPHLQINLHRTGTVSEYDNLQHDCLHVPAHIIRESDPRQIISYCMNEFTSKFQIKENDRDQKFTFEQLSKQNITNQQLYLWSAPIDLIEEYQFYLNQISKSETTTSLSTQIFYNCTLPYFGSQCQYVLQDYKPYHLSLDEIVHDYYRYNKYEPTLLTCYMHLECNRGAFPSCLDWTEICDGKVDCLDGRYDEEHCWQMEVSQHNESQYPGSNRQCISETYYRDDSKTRHCINEFDAIEMGNLISNEEDPLVEEPIFEYEDISCVKRTNMKDSVDVLTSSCIHYRQNLLMLAMFSIKPNWLSDECWTAMKLFISVPINDVLIYQLLCSTTKCREIINKTCPNIIYVPAVPVLMGNIYVAYDKNILIEDFGFLPPTPTYFCYDDQLFYISNNSNKKLLYDNDTCRLFEVWIPFSHDIGYGEFQGNIAHLYWWLQLNTISTVKNFELLDKSTMYKCTNGSKYISKYRLFDGVIDCYHLDDEEISNEICSKQQQNMNYFKCITTDKCIPIYLVQNGVCDCGEGHNLICDDEQNDPDLFYFQTTISFQTICDGYTHLLQKFIKDENETDETNCEHWPLIHIYNHCDGFWDRPDGSDEINCDPSPSLNCSTNHHICISPTTNQLMCLSIENANNGIIDCLGAADEPTLCQEDLHKSYSMIFYCDQGDYNPCTEARMLCDNNEYCRTNDDEKACNLRDLSEVSLANGICTGNYESHGSDTAKVLCRRFSYIYPKSRVYFTLDQWPNLIKQHLKEENSFPREIPRQRIQSYQQHCHRGLHLQVWLDKDKNLTKTVCLCPPSYYGEICQYQNQRVSLTLQFRVTSDSVQTPFIIIVSLIDDTNERIIHSYEQFNYLSIKHCQRRFNVYLLYSTRPKNETKDYFVHIDIYEKSTLNYRASFIKSLNFPFLPVHRVALRINIPPIIDNLHDCSNVECVHGKCRKYFNDRNNRTFCQCESGWSGRTCSIQYTSMCSSNKSLSIGKLANNRSLCVCPVNKMGPRCLIDDNTCQNNENVTCFNKGECIVIDQYKTLNKTFVCICPKDFTGDQCEIARTKLILTFDRNISLPSSILIHFIEVKFNAPPVRTTTFKTTSFGQNSIIIYWSLPFHIVFAELLNKTYYLTHMKTIYYQSSIIEKTLNSSDRCLHINELFNETIVSSSLIRRIKYYHLLCQINSSQLKCFYDEIHLCLCQQVNQQYVANCFEFDHNMNLNCSGQSGCQNGGQCFQEQTSCPRISVCVCPICYYGSRCQLSASGFSLSLDAILGYHIRPNLNISHQPLAVLISLILTVIIVILGLLNSLLLFITFRNKTTQESGCGIYLLSSSVIILSTMIIFFLKFLIVLLSQMGSITNRSFLKVQCHSIDFLLRFSLTMDQWLTAFVAIERTFIMIKGIKFNKKKSKLVAKWTISSLILMNILTNIHDPIYRSLFEENDDDDDDDKKRFWCIADYPSAIRIINLIINIFHFIIPFIINLISAIIIIIMTTRQHAAIKKKKYQEILNEQIQQHKNLLIGPCVLVILGIPRLIISFTSGCMKSSSDSWLFLMGYFISLIPSLLTFVLFVLPSTTYKQAFREGIKRYRNIIR